MDWIMDYTVMEAVCPVCGGSNHKNDLSFGALGRLNLVYRTSKLAQAVMKATLTDKGINDYFPDYGTTLSTMIGSQNYSNDILLRTEIFNQLKTIKNTYDKAFINNPSWYDPFELLEDILGVDLLPSEDPRAITLRVHVMCKALEEVITKPIAMVR
jgi:hypothetical protein